MRMRVTDAGGIWRETLDEELGTGARGEGRVDRVRGRRCGRAVAAGEGKL
jgi:hypothetical protein